MITSATVMLSVLPKQTNATIFLIALILTMKIQRNVKTVNISLPLK
jgi:hypothetical protein